MDSSSVNKEQKKEYIGKSFAFGGVYSLIPIEETFLDISKCPKEDLGKLVIIEFMNNGTPMFFPIDLLNPNDWVLFED